MTSRIALSLVLTSAIYSTSVHADWKSLLNDITSNEAITSAVTSGSTSNLDYDTIVSGLKQALEVGTKDAIDKVSQNNGYLSNELIKISMPPQLEKLSGIMRKFGLSSQADEFEQSMNRAAEKAAPQATDIIISAIKNMSFDDAKEILNGSDDAATQFFKQNTSEKLTSLFEPVITDSLNKVGTTKYYNELTDEVSDIPFVGENVNLDLSSYVTQQALNGLFTMIAAEEKKIRENPAARTTELLQKVFSSN
jgi:ribosomal protein L22